MTQFARPYAGGGPLPGANDANMAIGIYLVDPVTGNPITPAGTVAGGSGSNPAGVSTTGTVGTTSAVIATAGQFPHWASIQNTHATNQLHISFTNPATQSDFTIAPGGALTLPSGTSNGINAIGSAAGTTYAIIGF